MKFAVIYYVVCAGELKTGYGMEGARVTKKGPGRPQLYEDRMVKISVRLPEKLRKYALVLGDGAIGAGIRAALVFTMQWRSNIDGDTT